MRWTSRPLCSEASSPEHLHEERLSGAGNGPVLDTLPPQAEPVVVGSVLPFDKHLSDERFGFEAVGVWPHNVGEHVARLFERHSAFVVVDAAEEDVMVIGELFERCGVAVGRKRCCRRLWRRCWCRWCASPDSE